MMKLQNASEKSLWPSTLTTSNSSFDEIQKRLKSLTPEPKHAVSVKNPQTSHLDVNRKTLYVEKRHLRKTGSHH